MRPPVGRVGRPSKALTVDQAQALLRAEAARHGRGEGEPFRLLAIGN